MPVAGFDHVAITVADVDATIDFYCKVLGAELLLEDLWREGKMPIALITVGANRMSLHPAAAPAKHNQRRTPTVSRCHAAPSSAVKITCVPPSAAHRPSCPRVSPTIDAPEPITVGEDATRIRHHRARCPGWRSRR